MLPLAVTKKRYRNSEAERRRHCPHRGALCCGWDCSLTATARLPTYKAGMRAARGNHLQRSRLLTKNPTRPQAWKVAASEQSVHKVSDYLLKNNLQKARGDVLEIRRNFPNFHELYETNCRDTCNLFHPIQPRINMSERI